MINIAVAALNSEIEDLQRIIDADEAILAHEQNLDKRRDLIDEIDRLQDRIKRISSRRDSLIFG